MKNWVKLIISLVVPQLAGVIGSVFTVPNIGSWYATLAKPALNPPSWVFGPVWTALFVLMGIAAFLVWKRHSDILQNVRMLRVWKWGIALFIIQLLLNILWSVLFFGLQSPSAALAEILVLWVAIVATLFAFGKISRAAGWLLVPYLLWVSFAVYLNYMIVALN